MKKKDVVIEKQKSKMKSKKINIILLKKKINEISVYIAAILSLISIIAFTINIILIFISIIDYNIFMKFEIDLHNYIDFMRIRNFFFLAFVFIIFRIILSINNNEPKIFKNVFFNKHKKIMSNILLMTQILLLINLLIVSFICGQIDSCNCNYSGPDIIGKRLNFNLFFLYVEFSWYIFCYYTCFIYSFGSYRELYKKRKDKK